MTRFAPLTHFFLKREVSVCVFSSHCVCMCVCVCVCVPPRLAWLVWAESGKVSLSPKGNSSVHLTSFNSTETFKMPFKTGCPTGSGTVGAHRHYHNLSINTTVSTEPLRPPRQKRNKDDALHVWGPRWVLRRRLSRAVRSLCLNSSQQVSPAVRESHGAAKGWLTARHLPCQNITSYSCKYRCSYANLHCAAAHGHSCRKRFGRHGSRCNYSQQQLDALLYQMGARRVPLGLSVRGKEGVELLVSKVLQRREFLNSLLMLSTRCFCI